MDAGSLSSTLKDLRKQARLSQVEAAKRSGLGQHTISRFETGHQVPDDEQLRELCRAYRAPAPARRELMAAARELRDRATAVRPVLSRGPSWQIQARIGRIERHAMVIREFSPLIISGLVQTEAYMRAVFGQRMRPVTVQRSVAERRKRQEQLRDGQDARVVMPEGALYWMAVSPAVMEEQLTALAAIAAAPSPRVRLGIIPWDRAADVFPVHAWTAYDDREVIIGTWAGTSFVTGPDVAVYVERFDALERLAQYGEAARQTIETAARRYGSLT